MRRRETAGLIPADDAFPQFRLWTFGILRMEVLVDPEAGSYRQLPLSLLGGKYGRMLLTSLLCSERRRLLRPDLFDRILLHSSEEDLETDAGSGKDPEKLAASRLKGAIRSLTLLFIPEGKTESYCVIEEEIDCYRLADQQVIWVDADAFLDLLDQAQEAVRCSHDPLPLVKQAADYFANGMFLAHDEGWWIAARRTTLEERQEHCIQWLIDLYEQRQLWWEAEGYLMRLLERDPSDEAAFSRLMDVLIKQGKYTEAFVYARSLRELLNEEEIEMSETTKAIMTQVLRLHKKRAQGSLLLHDLPQKPLAGKLLLPPGVSSPSVQREEGEPWGAPLLFGEAQERGLVLPTTVSMLPLPVSATAAEDCATWFSERLAQIIAFVTQWQKRVSYTQFQKMLDQELRVFDEKKALFHSDEYFLTRRNALLVIAALPTGLLHLIQRQQQAAFIEEEFLPSCAASLTACWYLLNGREFASVEQTVSRYMGYVIMWARKASPYQTTAAYLAAQGCLLLSLVASHHLWYQHRVTYCEQAVAYAKISKDRVVLVKALTMLGNALYDQQNYRKMLQRYLEAKILIDEQPDEIPQILRSKTLMGLAHAYAQQGQEQEALNILSEARATFPESTEEVPPFLSTDDGLYSLILFEGWVHLDLGKRVPQAHHYAFATQALTQIEQIPETVLVPERIRLEITNRRAQAAIGLGELETFLDYTLQGAKSVQFIQSGKRRQEIVENFKAARKKWPEERRVLELADALF